MNLPYRIAATRVAQQFASLRGGLAGAAIGLRSALLLAFAVTLGLSTSTGAWGLLQLREVDQANRNLAHGEALGVNVAQSMRSTMSLQVQALRDVWLRGSDPTQLERYSADFDTRVADMRVLRAQLEEALPSLTSEELADVALFDVEWKRYVEAWPLAKAAYGGAGGGRAAAADAVLRGMDRQPAAALSDLVDRLTVGRDAHAAAIAEQVAQSLRWGILLLGIAFLMGIAHALLFVHVLLGATRPVLRAARQIARHDLPTFASTAEALARGDLSRSATVTTLKIPTSRFADLRVMAGDFNEMIDALQASQTTFSRMGAELARKAYYDELTSLPNRALLVARLERTVQASVLSLDLDRFKRVNDSFGREAGDRLLLDVAARLKACVPVDGTLARVGGDEFVVLLTGNEPASARAVAEAMLDRMRSPFVLYGHHVVVGVSIGIATGAGAEGDALLRDADLALTQAIDLGRGRYHTVERGADDRAIRRMELESDLRLALERGELRVYYQPIRDLAADRLVGVEALVRWERPGIGLVSPDTFVPLADATGLIVPIGDWVLVEAYRQARRWQKDRAGGPLSVSVNLSARQLQQTDLVDRVSAVLETTELDPALLKLEVTESAAMESVDPAIATLVALKALGVKLAIDDFGTGYSSLAYLKRFPVDTLKIDRSFVQSLEHDPSSRSVIGAIIALARALDMDVTAEGIETEGQLEHLRRLQCSHGQGFLFARPAPAAAIDTPVAPTTLVPIARLTPRLIFVGLQDAGPARLAAALTTSLSSGRVHAMSAGLVAGPPPDADLASVLAALDPMSADAPPRSVTPELLQTAALVVAIGCGDACPYVPGIAYRGWSIEDSPTISLDRLAPVQAELDERVRLVLREIGIPVQRPSRILTAA